jgi:plastocyanin
MRMILRLFGPLGLILAAGSCGGGSTAPGNGGGGGGSGGPCPANTFCMGSSVFFTPATSDNPSLTLATNTPVTWTNGDGGPHDVVFTNPTAALAVPPGLSGNIPQHTSGSNQRQFANPGTYPFHCTIHGTATTGMRGSVVVQ